MKMSQQAHNKGKERTMAEIEVDERLVDLAQKLYSEDGHSGNIYKKASPEMLRQYEWKAIEIIKGGK